MSSQKKERKKEIKYKTLLRVSGMEENSGSFQLLLIYWEALFPYPQKEPRALALSRLLKEEDAS